MLTRSYFFFGFLTFILLLYSSVVPAQQRQLLQTFTLTESLGIAHTEQIIEFDLQQAIDPTKTTLLGEDGAEAPYQAIAGGKKIAMRTDLPAGGRKSWTLVANRAPAPVQGGVQVSETAGYYEITNGLTGVRIAKATTELTTPPAPVQGVRLRDGTWTGSGPNTISAARGTTFKVMTVRFLERGPLTVTVEVAYTLARPDLRSNQNNAILIPAGEGFYRSTIEVQAGQPSILFEEDADCDLQYSVNLHPGVEPTQARYRGHHATKAAFGREADGQTYRGSYVGAFDALVDLRFDRPMPAIYAASDGSYRYMAVWDPWVFDSGWYWQVYNAAAPENANLIGIFAGSPSRAIGAAASGVGIFTNPAPKQAGITIACVRLCADTRYFSRIRYAWGLFTGVKGQDLKPVNETQPINRQMNIHGGINLNKVTRFAADYPDPPQGVGALYMPKTAVQRLITKLRTDRDFYNYCYNTEPQSRGLIDLLADASGAKAHTAAKEVIEGSRRQLDRIINGEGIYARPHYWEGGQFMTEKAVWIEMLLASGQVTPEERAALKAIDAAFGNILWDDDYVPLTLPHGLNLAQGPIQYLGFRSFYALRLAGLPAFKDRAAEVEKMTLAALPGIINEDGAGVACTHYMSPYVASTLNTLLQLKQLGKDYYRSEPRLAKFAEFYLNFLTPPEPRFGGKRKYIATSDSSTESSELYGVLATGFRAANPELSAQLMGAWQAGGRHLDSRFGSCLLRIDTEAPAKDPNLGSAAFPGYYSVLRYGWGTPNETAAWVINGDFYREHRHPDQGMVVLYALGAPVSVHWSSLYYPQVSGAFLNSTALLESMIPVPWDADSPPLGTGGGWGGSMQEAFLSFPSSAYARQHYINKGTTWTRVLAAIHPTDTRPAILIRDTFTGENAAAPKVFTLNLLAQGAVDTPAGAITPIPRKCPVTQKPTNDQLPSAGQVFSLPAGLNRLGFTGQYLIDWDLYTFSDRPQQALLGNWAVSWHQETNPFEERQHILRLRGDGGFFTLLLPWRKGEKPADLRLTREGATVRITAGGEQFLVTEHGYAFYTPSRQALAAFTTDPISGAGISLSGGPAEVVVTGAQAQITVHGAAGTRIIKLPGAWRPATAKPSMKLVKGGWQITYAGGAPLSVTMVAVKR